MFIVQNESRPAEVQNALYDLMRDRIVSVRICSAYVTLSGSEILYDGISRSAHNGNVDAVQKTIVTSFDFGLTEPRALRFWQDIPNCQVLITGGTSLLGNRTLIPQVAFHPKFYLFGRHDGTVGSLVCSANLTNRGMTINAEVGWLEFNNAANEADSAWIATAEHAVPLTDELLEQYDALRPAGIRPTNPEILPVPRPPMGTPARYQPFADMAADLGAFSQLWVQSRGMQGGAGTQLELPRGAHRFFGAAYRGYHFERVEHIAEPILIAGGRTWRDRPLTWHGDNAMERINLPSRAMGGFNYENSLILFRRLGRNRFEFRVYPWDSDSARAYVNTSRRANLVFRVGRNSPRLAGLVP